MMTYLILFLVAGYLFKVNPVLCVGLVEAVVFFKIRGFFGSRKSHARSSGTTESTAVLVALCIILLNRSGRKDPSRHDRLTIEVTPTEDPLEGLFLN